MRYQDRLLKLCPPDRPLLAQYLAREMEGLVLYFDSSSVVRALQEMQLTTADPGGVQAALALRRLEPVHLHQIYAPSAVPVQSRLLDSTALDELESGASGVDETLRQAQLATQSTMHRAMTMLMEPLIEPLLLIIETAEGPRRRRAMSVAARLQHKKIASALERVAGTPGDPDAPLAALLVTECAVDNPGETILEAVRKHTESRTFPGMVLALGAAPSRESLRLLEAAITAEAVEALPAAAAAAEGFGAAEVEPLLEQLCLGGQGWATVNALETLGRLRAPRALELITRTYRRLDHVTLRAAAVKVAGTLGGDEAHRFLADVLANRPEPPIAARALEGLIRTARSSIAHAGHFAGFLENPNPDAAVAAALGLARTDKLKVAQQLRRWLLNTDPAWRLEAAYCLGYMQGDFALSLLEKLALCDPDTGVRAQSLRSLALYEKTGPAVATLLRIVGGPDRMARLQAASLLGNPVLSEEREVFACMVKAYQGAGDAPEASVVARAMGKSGSALAREFLVNMSKSETDPVRLRGILDGLDLGSSPMKASFWKPFATGGSAIVRSATARARWNSGDPEGIGELADLLASSPEDAELAFDEIERVSVTSLHLSEQERFKPLRGCLRDALRSRSYQDFAASEYSVHLSPERLPGNADPAAAEDMARRWDPSEAKPLAGNDLNEEIERVLRRSAPGTHKPHRAYVQNLEGKAPVMSVTRVLGLLFCVCTCVLLALGAFRTTNRILNRPPERSSRVRDTSAAFQVLGMPGGALIAKQGAKAGLRIFPGSGLRPGSRVRTSDGKPLMLAGPSGEDRIVLFPSTVVEIARITWERTRGTGNYEITLKEGALFLGLAGSRTRCLVHLPGGALTAYKGALVVRTTEDSAEIKVGRGRAELSGSASQGITVIIGGQKSELADGKTGQVADCDPEEEVFRYRRGPV